MERFSDSLSSARWADCLARERNTTKTDKAKRTLVAWVLVIALVMQPLSAGAASSAAWWTCTDTPHNAAAWGFGYKEARADTAFRAGFNHYVATSKYNPGYRYGRAYVSHYGQTSLWCGW